MSGIHRLALVDEGARLGQDVSVGPFAVIEGDVEIGDGTSVAAHAVIKRYTHIGRRNRIMEHAVIGGEPQDLKFGGWKSEVEVGDDNWIREHVTVHRGSKEGGVTRVGSNVFLMATAHIAHDCQIGDHVIMANGSMLGGYVVVEPRAFISGSVTVHQFCRVGSLAMLAGGSRIVQDALPFVITDGHPGRARGLNVVGLRRAGYSREDMSALKRAFLSLRAGAGLRSALADMDAMDSPPVAELAAFIRASERGFAHPS